MSLKAFSIVLLVVLFPAVGLAFGKNKIQYTQHGWYYIQSPHFDIYFYETDTLYPTGSQASGQDTSKPEIGVPALVGHLLGGGERLAQFVADVAESSYVALKHDFQYELLSRIPIIVYNSHNDFEGTNVTSEIPEESVGGFTEFFKNRIVLPFQGSYRDFRHVIRHELTHAVMMQMLYGSSVGSIVYGLARFSLPLWFVEGLAEYESLTWDAESDLWMRDAVAYEYLPPIDGLNGFFAYKGGQSVFEYIRHRYGREKVGEILTTIRKAKSLDGALLETIGLTTDELSTRWSWYLKSLYGDEIGRRERPSDIARRLTAHERLGSAINHSPAIAPDGGRVAFLSDRSDYFDIYLASTHTGEVFTKLISGQKSSRFEELHWLQPGMSWSPDGSRLAFAAKAGGRDALYLLDVDRKRIIQQFRFDHLDGIFSPAWSPTDSQIAFMGMRAGQSDLYLLDLASGNLRQLIEDPFSDASPAWSPDGQRIAFCSDRGDSLSGHPPGLDVGMQDVPSQQIDIYVIGVDDGQIERITRTPALERTPVWSPDGRLLAFTADENGVFNILLQRLSDGARWPITNVLTGCDHLSWSADGSELAFAAFAGGGYDIYLLPDPLSRPEILLDPAAFLTDRRTIDRRAGDLVADTSVKTARKRYVNTRDFSHHVFDDKFFGSRRRQTDVPNVTVDGKSEDGRYRVKRYSPTFSLDLLDAGAAYSQFFGFQGLTQIGMSDMLGNHQILIAANVIRRLEDSDYAAAYSYFPRRTDYSVIAFHSADFLATDLETVRFRNFGAGIGISYPLSRYHRIGADVSYLNFRRDGLGYFQQRDSKTGIITRAELFNDTVIWGFTGPTNGSRYRIGVEYSPGIGGLLDYRTYLADYRTYL
ncbi:MAG: PD40 domain-containing protein, partial [Candidatus Latescibacteria bacterium]|nr:PD40 domain-containing protein [Candidatus Latescibacterota bacterium]